MSKRIITLGLILLLIIVIMILVVWLLQPGTTVITEKEFEGVIFTKERAADVLRYIVVNEVTEEAYWTPSKDEVFALEQQLNINIARKDLEFKGQLSDFKRQYFGFIRDGNQLVLIVGFCEPVGVEWHRELVTLPDMAVGCYFEAQYDPANDKILYLWQNSEQ